MRKARGTAKLFLLLLFILISYLGYFLVYLILRLFRSPIEKARNFYMRNLSRGAAFILNIRIRTVGSPPEPPFFMVSNHLSYIDILPMFMNMRCTFVAKKEVESWPVLGFMVKTMGVIFVNRSRKRDVQRVNRKLADSLNENQGIVLFPEGTTTGGDRVLPFRSSLLDLPATERIPVYYSALQYRTGPKDPPAEETVCFYGARDSFQGHLFKLACNHRIDAVVYYGKTPVVEGDRKKLAQLLHAEVERVSFRVREEIGMPA